MPLPKVTVLGAYRVECTNALLEEAFELKHDLPPEHQLFEEKRREVRDEIESAVLVELQVDDDGALDRLPYFSQPSGPTPTDNDQVMWLERYLSDDGQQVLSESGFAREGKSLRVAFFIHYFREDMPLVWEYGEFRCPAPQQMPPRLATLCPYEPVD